MGGKEREKMANMLKLKARIVEMDKNVESVAKEIGIDKSTFYRKMQSDGDDFTIQEVISLCKVLEMDLEAVNSIFFDTLVA